jgi:hypothetical protein
VTAAVNGAMHGSSVRGLEGRLFSMDHDRGGQRWAASIKAMSQPSSPGGMPRPMIVRMRNELRAKTNDTHARTRKLQESPRICMLSANYAIIIKTLAFLMFQCVARLSSACISSYGRVPLPASPLRHVSELSEVAASKWREVRSQTRR